MNLEKLFEENHADLTNAAYIADSDLARKIFIDAQAEWDSGITFCGMGYVLGNQRTGDTPEELDIACSRLQSSLAGLVLDTWVKKLSGKDVATLCNALSALNNNASVQISDTDHFSPFDIMRAWNEAHPDEKQIQYHTDWEI